jgi:hypothetical protein
MLGFIIGVAVTLAGVYAYKKYKAVVDKEVADVASKLSGS